MKSMKNVTDLDGQIQFMCVCVYLFVFIVCNIVKKVFEQKMCPNRVRKK